MSDKPQIPITELSVQADLPGDDAIVVRRDLQFGGADGQPLPFDLYLPTGASATRPPVVILVEGYSDAGFVRVVGCPFRAMRPVTSWARLLAAAGMAVVVGSNRAPADDALALLRVLGTAGSSYGIDGDRIGLWASSGNAPVALSLLVEAGVAVRCAAFCYPLLLDLDGATEVADAAATFRFANPCAGRSFEELPTDVPLFVARAGRDETPGLNRSLDRFVAGALQRDLPLTVVNVPRAPHAFDLVDERPPSRRTVREIVEFLQRHLGVGSTGIGA